MPPDITPAVITYNARWRWITNSVVKFEVA
jgi:hypothetical protein